MTLDAEARPYREQIKRLLELAEADLRVVELDSLAWAINEGRKRAVSVQEVVPALIPRAVELGDRLMHQLQDADKDLTAGQVGELEVMIHDRLERL
jgi:hypothetical protein